MSSLKGFLTVPCECNITPPDDLLSDLPIIFLNCHSGPQGKGMEESSKLTSNNSLELIKAGPLPSWYFLHFHLRGPDFPGLPGFFAHAPWNYVPPVDLFGPYCPITARLELAWPWSVMLLPDWRQGRGYYTIHAPSPPRCEVTFHPIYCNP